MKTKKKTIRKKIAKRKVSKKKISRRNPIPSINIIIDKWYIAKDELNRPYFIKIKNKDFFNEGIFYVETDKGQSGTIHIDDIKMGPFENLNFATNYILKHHDSFIRKNPLRTLSKQDKENLQSRLDRANSWVTYYSDLYSEALRKRKDQKTILKLKKEWEDSVRVRDEILNELSSDLTYGQDW